MNVDEKIAKEGGILKAKYSIENIKFSYGDAIILSTAINTQSIFITYDKEFDAVKEVVVRTPEELIRDIK